ncbi:hypothetical protein ACLOAV_006930 [Pseudogymnoascus australis]
MSGAEVNLAAAALAIALVALISTVGQLLQQYFATADGYRRCRKSVVGEYARKTRLHWRWREFRFETLYTTPDIFLTGDGAPSRKRQAILTGSEDSRHISLVPRASITHEELEIDDEAYEATPVRGKVHYPQDSTDKRLEPSTSFGGEMASWIPLLHWVHESVHASLQHETNIPDPVSFAPPKFRLPAVIFRERSWDFQPPDALRPLAKTTLSDIAIIARRMGMKWKDFRPSEGILRAEGHSHTITSTVVRSLGIILQYSYTGQSQRLRAAELNIRGDYISGSIIPEKDEIYILRAGADRLGCGVLRADTRLSLPDLTVSTQSEIITALSFLDRRGTSSEALTSILKEHPGFRFRVADLVALTVPSVRRRGSSLVQVPAPSDNVRGVTTSTIGRRAFHQCLESYVAAQKGDVGTPTQQALEICRTLRSQFAAWDHTDEKSPQEEEWVIRRDPQYLDLVQGHLYTLTDQLDGWEQRYSFRYLDLLGVHIRVAMFCKDGETSVVRTFSTDYRADVEGYFRVLPSIIEEMSKTGYHDRHMIVDAWVTMMLRALCWGACHFFVPGERVPIEYFGSQLPVYIG